MAWKIKKGDVIELFYYRVKPEYNGYRVFKKYSLWNEPHIIITLSSDELFTLNECKFYHIPYFAVEQVVINKTNCNRINGCRYERKDDNK